MRPDHDSIKELYGRGFTNRDILAGDAKPPAGADKLKNILDRTSARRDR